MTPRVYGQRITQEALVVKCVCVRERVNIGVTGGTMMDEDKYKGPLFDGRNFSDWKYRLELHLDELDLLPHIQNDLDILLAQVNDEEGDSNAVRRTKEEKRVNIIKNDKRCKNQVVSRLHNALLEVVKSATTAFELWIAL